MSSILSVENLTIEIQTNKKSLHIVKDVCFDLKENSCLGIVGESGSGRSTLGKIIIGVEKSSSGNVFINGKNINKLKSRKDKISVKKDVSVVFQDYTSSVNPRFRVLDIIS